MKVLLFLLRKYSQQGVHRNDSKKAKMSRTELKNKFFLSKSGCITILNDGKSITVKMLCEATVEKERHGGKRDMT